MTIDQFHDRVEAGRLLAIALAPLRGTDLVVLGVPRGGVPVAAEVAELLMAPLDVVVVRKLGLPAAHEVAMGAVSEGGTLVVDRGLMQRAHVTQEQFDAVEKRETDVLDVRANEFRHGRAPLDVSGKTVVVVDDGLATGATATAACSEARTRGAATVILAIPVGADDTIAEFTAADEIVCLKQPVRFFAVGQHYRDFGQTSDAEVVRLLDEAVLRSGRRE